MASNKSLNAACNLDGYLFFEMPTGALEVEVKVILTTHGERFSMVQDIHTRTEKYHVWKRLMAEAPLRPERGRHLTR